jgi:parallel beta-helix repeat protein
VTYPHAPFDGHELEELVKLVSIACVSSALLASASAATITVPGNQPTIQAGVLASSPGDTILVSAGTYEENVDIPGGFDGITIKAKGKVILDCRPSGATGTGPGFAVASQNVTIQGFTIRHAKGTNPHGVYSPAGGTGLRLNKLTIEHTDGPGISIQADGARIENTTVNGCDGGMLLFGENILVSKCTVRQDGTRGVGVFGNNGVVSKCKFLTIEDGNAVVIVGANGVIEMNTVDGADAAALFSEGDNPTIRSNKILRQCDDDAGIEVLSTTTGLIEKNVIRNTYEDGIEVQSNVSGLTITKNTITNCGTEDESSLFVGGSNCIVSKNVIRGGQQDGILVSGDDNTIESNVVIDCLEDGIDLEVGADGSVVTGNKCLNNRGEGFENNGTNTTLINNTMKGNRIDFANDGSFAATPPGNVFATGGTGTAPEIDD